MAQCDKKSVGIVIKKGRNFVVILRKNYPISYAFVAGHLDGDTSRQAAIKESIQEANVSIDSLKHLWSGTFSNPCKRDGGGFHEWSVWEAVKWHGEVEAGDDAKEAFILSPQKVHALIKRTRSFEKRSGIPLTKKNVDAFTKYVVDDSDWQKDPGLEPVWVLMLEKIGILLAT
ncbi:MAG: NUDIX hydrolase [Parcubacteria group bacterium]|nr:NUDIX hydrolase [Parcubacteria group bacterium]